ncbi:N-acetyltransferase [Olivibacter sp. SDN3]|uniref:GNAT family N-acetyltransferase n=1 Tax=Olivibacter sp. SDN3 TaxID=2764720 RepID=UPI00165161E7|nr:GNAT family N-acetyltransferase [Olivibacter sp. SDN3]QNL48084.1 N-acetyltransferase [Olivibacter sp. SDN3]
MNMAFENIPLNKNDENHRFELQVDGHTAFIDYGERNGKAWLIHTESPPELAGRGVATALIAKTLTWLKDNSYTLIPLCPLVVAFIKRHPDWLTIVDEAYRKPFEH